MAHYAFIDSNNIVTDVIVGKDEDNTTDLPEGFADWEAWYSDFKGQTCKRTSYNTIANTHREGGTPFRGNYAGIGYTWDETNNVFYQPQPYGSWTLSSDWVWEAPIAYPGDDNDNLYIWNENAYQADTADPKTAGWELQA